MKCSCNQIAAEFIGTFVLIFAATATPIVNEKTSGSVTLVGNAATAGLAIMIVIFATGHISGAHVNPGITIAFASLRHFPWIQVLLCVSLQAGVTSCNSFSNSVNKFWKHT
jgi:aquaporin NIP